MFSPEHFIWLAIAAAIACGMFVIHFKFKLSFDTVLNIMITVSIISEVTKILCNMEESLHEKGGMVLDPGDLPFHLCSIQILLILMLKFFVKSDSAKERLLGFMCPTMLIGAVCALFIPTVGTSFTKVQVYQYFIYHAFLIFFASYVLKERLVKWSFRSYIYNLGYLGIFALICMWINSALSGGYPGANFMYLVRPPMEDLPVLNLNHGWIVYIIILAALAVSLLGIFHIAVTLPGYIKSKAAKKAH